MELAYFKIQLKLTQIYFFFIKNKSIVKKNLDGTFVPIHISLRVCLD